MCRNGGAHSVCRGVKRGAYDTLLTPIEIATPPTESTAAAAMSQNFLVFKSSWCVPVPVDGACTVTAGVAVTARSIASTGFAMVGGGGVGVEPAVLVALGAGVGELVATTDAVGVGEADCART